MLRLPVVAGRRLPRSSHVPHKKSDASRFFYGEHGPNALKRIKLCLDDVVSAKLKGILILLKISSLPVCCNKTTNYWIERLDVLVLDCIIRIFRCCGAETFFKRIKGLRCFKLLKRFKKGSEKG